MNNTVDSSSKITPQRINNYRKVQRMTPDHNIYWQSFSSACNCEDLDSQFAVDRIVLSVASSFLDLCDLVLAIAEGTTD